MRLGIVGSVKELFGMELPYRNVLPKQQQQEQWSLVENLVALPEWIEIQNDFVLSSDLQDDDLETVVEIVVEVSAYHSPPPPLSTRIHGFECHLSFLIFFGASLARVPKNVACTLIM